MTVRPEARCPGQAVGSGRSGKDATVTDQPSDTTSVVLWCAHAGGCSLDRGVCASPCEAVHLRCTTCGAALGTCPYESPGHHERLVRRLRALVGDETEALMIVAIVEKAGRAGPPVTWDTARAIARGSSDRSGRHRRTTSPA